MRLHRIAVVASALVAFSRTGQAQSPPPLLLREPALSATDICFSYAGDLWTVPRAGGTAHRLTASPGLESGCRYSADGKWIAYTNTINQNADVYVITAEGGAPKRLTYRPGADRTRGWTSDGKVLFMSDREGIALTQAGGAPRLFAQAPDAVQATAVDLPSVWDGSFSGDAKRLAYLPFPPANRAWKRYRGRPDHADLARDARRRRHREGAAPRIHRSVADVDRGHGVLRERPRRAGDALCL
jgi:tricorn protease